MPLMLLDDRGTGYYKVIDRPANYQKPLIIVAPYMKFYGVRTMRTSFNKKQLLCGYMIENVDDHLTTMNTAFRAYMLKLAARVQNSISIPMMGQMAIKAFHGASPEELEAIRLAIVSQEKSYMKVRPILQTKDADHAVSHEELVFAYTEKSGTCLNVKMGLSQDGLSYIGTVKEIQYDQDGGIHEFIHTPKTMEEMIGNSAFEGWMDFRVLSVSAWPTQRDLTTGKGLPNGGITVGLNLFLHGIMFMRS